MLHWPQRLCYIYRMLRLLAFVAVSGVVFVGACSEGAREWSPAVQVDSTVGGFRATLVRGANDAALLVYLREPSDALLPLEVVASRLGPDGRWGEPTVVGTGVDGFQVPAAAVDDAGHAVVGWVRPTEVLEDDEIWASRHVPGEGWTPQELVGFAGEVAERPSAAMRSDGTSLLAWRRFRRSADPADRQVVVREYVQGEGWRSLEPWPTGQDSVSFVTIGVDDEERVVAAWFRRAEDARGNDDGARIAAARWTAGAGWGEESILPVPLPFIDRIQIDRQGTVWLYRPGAATTGNEPCQLVVRNTAAGWEQPTYLKPNCELGNGGSLSVDDDGAAIAVWSEGFDDPISAFSSSYRPGEGWTAPQPMPVGQGSRAPSYSVGATRRGGAVALWYRQAEDDPALRLSVWAAELGAGGQWTEAQRLESSGIVSFGQAPFERPLTVAYPDGSAVGSWLRYQGSLEPSRPTPEFTPWAAEFR